MMANALRRSGSASFGAGRRAFGPRGIVASMAVAIVACGTAAFLDERAETAASRVDFAHEQTTLARGVAVALSARLRELPGQPLLALREVVGPVEEPGSLLVFVTGDDKGGLIGTSGTVLRSPRIAEALDDGRCVDALERRPCSFRISHDESVALGLPPRTSVAAFAGFTDATGERRWVVIAATARRNSDREERAVVRLVLAFVFSSILVLAFGTLALRTQRKELELERDLAVAEAVRDRDGRLGRADKMAALGAMATGIAHQVATPLGVIMARVEQLLGRVSADERAQRAAVVIGEQTRRIESIIRAFLGLARGGTPALEHIDAAQLARAAAGFVEHRLAQSSIALTVTVDPSLPEVACDPPLMEQAIVNLLLNACDACEAGGRVDLAVSVVADRVRISVTDDGSGIDPEAASRALEPFFTTKPKGRGSGLGLTIANEIVAHHQGVLKVEPRADCRGTRASIELLVIGESPRG
jgi:signal transduction histidine kinase